MKPLSIQLYTVREAAKDDFIGVLRQIAEIGYKGVEPAGLHGHDPKEIRKVIDDLGMTCSSGHGPMPDDDNVAERIDTARALGFTTLVASTGPADFKSAETVKALADRFHKAATLLEPHGLTLAMHNHWWEMARIDGRLGWEMLMEMVPQIVSEMDIYWASNFGAVDPAALIAEHRSRIPLLHVKDGPLVKDAPHTAVGSGKVDVPPCVEAADPSVLQWLIVELDSYDGDMMDAVRDSYTYLTGNGLAAGNR